MLKTGSTRLKVRVVSVRLNTGISSLQGTANARFPVSVFTLYPHLTQHVCTRKFAFALYLSAAEILRLWLTIDSAVHSVSMSVLCALAAAAAATVLL